MPFTSFTVKNSYSLSTHYVVFDHNNMYVKLISDNSTVKTLGLGGVIDIRVNSGVFEIGTINGLSGSFNRTIDFNVATAAITFNSSTNMCIGDTDTDQITATKYEYTVSQSNTPIRIVKDNSTQIVTFTCPCDASNCVGLNSGYTQVN